MQAAERLIEPEEYLARERAAEFKSELLDGQIVGMAGGTYEHAQLAANALWRLAAQLDDRPCRVLGSGIRVKAATRSNCFYPDVSVACGILEFTDDHRDTLLNPLVVIEVLSPSTETYDRGVKWGEYQLLPSLQHYLLIAQDRMCVEIYTRQGESWLYSSHSEADALVELAAVGCSLRVGDLYHKVEFTAAEA